MRTKIIQVDGKFYIERGWFVKRWLSREDAYWWMFWENASLMASYRSQHEAEARWARYLNYVNQERRTVKHL